MPELFRGTGFDRDSALGIGLPFPEEVALMTSPPFDGLLYTLLEHMTSPEEGFTGAITLFLPGQLVEGTPISEQEFLDRFAAMGDQMYNQFSKISEVARRDYRTRQERLQRGEVSSQAEPAAVSTEPLTELPLTYVHLKDARVLGVGNVEIIPLWRGRLSEVIAWNLGWDVVEGEEYGVYAT